MARSNRLCATMYGDTMWSRAGPSWCCREAQGYLRKRRREGYISPVDSLMSASSEGFASCPSQDLRIEKANTPEYLSLTLGLPWHPQSIMRLKPMKLNKAPRHDRWWTVKMRPHIRLHPASTPSPRLIIKAMSHRLRLTRYCRHRLGLRLRRGRMTLSHSPLMTATLSRSRNSAAMLKL